MFRTRNIFQIFKNNIYKDRNRLFQQNWNMIQNFKNNILS